MIQKLATLKYRRLKNELKKCVPITARTKKFPFKKGESTIIAERKQFPLILDYAITVHKSQRSTLSHVKGDLSRSKGKKTATSKNQQSIFQGQFYIFLSQFKSRGKVLLLNFDPEHIR